ncbi:helix-turn-helix domain-containing protein [Sphingobium yanoikuyae]|jgi:excisionase family DNA binding protein|uniref:helix-turn-helix domain-containing protein n=1 Tax=Sphingobium yanoikuyae TaxID=13690 RepID=UPI0035C7AF71
MDILNRKQAADRLNISLRTFERLRRDGKIPAPANRLKLRPLIWEADKIDALKG